MPVYLKNKEIDKIYLGNTQIDKIYKGSVLIYSAWEDGALFNEGQIWEEAGNLKIVGKNQAGANGVTVVTEEDHIYSSAKQYNGQNSGANVGFENPIDVTNYNTLYALVDYNFPEWSVACALQLGSTFGAMDKGYAVSHWSGNLETVYTSSGMQETIKIDLSNLSGSYYVGWAVDTTPNSPWIKHYKIWME